MTHALAETTILTGNVTKVRDGDTIEVGKVPIRLNGISAPEMKELLGVNSRAFMVEMVQGKRVRCELNGKKSYDRLWVFATLVTRTLVLLPSSPVGRWTAPGLAVGGIGSTKMNGLGCGLSCPRIVGKDKKRK